jgi:hypothetical protein
VHSPHPGAVELPWADRRRPRGHHAAGRIYARSWGAAKHDVAEGIHRPLTLTCLTFQGCADEPPLVLIAADLGWWRSREDEWSIRGPVLDALKLDESRLMFCLSHTHAGPGIQRDNADRPAGTSSRHTR